MFLQAKKVVKVSAVASIPVMESFELTLKVSMIRDTALDSMIPSMYDGFVRSLTEYGGTTNAILVSALKEAAKTYCDEVGQANNYRTFAESIGVRAIGVPTVETENAEYLWTGYSLTCSVLPTVVLADIANSDTGLMIIDPSKVTDGADYNFTVINNSLGFNEAAVARYVLELGVTQIDLEVHSIDQLTKTVTFFPPRELVTARMQELQNEYRI
jgi:hypothetical protein